MTPATATVDRWRLMTLQLGGEVLPALPPLPGRRHLAPKVGDLDPVAVEWDRRTVATVQPGWREAKP